MKLKSTKHGEASQGVSPITEYELPHGAGKGQKRPAFVTKQNADGTVNLVVFTDAGDELPVVWRVENVKV